MNENVPTFCPKTSDEWRAWLLKNHVSEKAVWLVYYKVNSGTKSITWSEAVNEALCFGWIDSLKKSIDDEKFMQFFCKRKPNSVWSKINKTKVEHLIQKGLMTKAGFDSIEIAKQNGSWLLLDDVEELNIPQDLEVAFSKFEGSRHFFINLSKSVRKSMLQWLALAKRLETRQKRINEIAEHAAKQLKPNHFSS